MAWFGINKKSIGKATEQVKTAGGIVAFDDLTLELVNKEINKLTSALNEANDFQNPDNINKTEFYNRAMLDAHLYSCVEIRRSFFNNDFEIVGLDGNPINSLRAIFEDYDGQATKWFKELMLHVHEGMLSGFSACQLGEIGTDKKPTSVLRIGDEYLIAPWNGCRKSIMKNVSDTNFISFDDNEYKNYIITSKSLDKNGLLSKVCKHVFHKDIQNNWRAYLQTSGADYLVAKTNINDATRKAHAETTLKALKPGSKITLHTDDVMELISSNNTSAGQDGYQLLIKQCDRYISSVLIGSDITAEKSFVGAVNVQETILKNIQRMDMDYVCRILNYSPAMRVLGLLPEKSFLRFKTDEQLDTANFLRLLEVTSKMYDIDKDDLESYVKMKLIERANNGGEEANKIDSEKLDNIKTDKINKDNGKDGKGDK